MTYRGLKWLEAFLSAGGGGYTDVTGYHFYVSPQPPEAMAPLIDSVRALIARHGLGARPLWNTETGWFIADRQTVVAPVGTGNDFRAKVLTEEEASGYVARAFTIGWAQIPGDAMERDELVALADKRLYEAKKAR